MDLEEIKKLYDGVLRIKDGKIVYPTRKRILEQVSEIEERMKRLKDEIRVLEKGRNKHFTYLDPLYIRHWIKMKIDREYRDAVEAVDLPVERIGEKRWRKVVSLFMKDKDYRERLVEALTSELGKHRKGLKKEAEELEKKREELIERRKKKCLEELEKLEKKKEVLMKMLEFC